MIYESNLFSKQDIAENVLEKHLDKIDNINIIKNVIDKNQFLSQIHYLYLLSNLDDLKTIFYITISDLNRYVVIFPKENKYFYAIYEPSNGKYEQVAFCFEGYSTRDEASKAMEAHLKILCG